MSEPAWSIDDVPEKPGVYLFRDAKGRVLYVGKARRLKSRLRSYRRHRARTFNELDPVTGHWTRL